VSQLEHENRCLIESNRETKQLLKDAELKISQFFMQVSDLNEKNLKKQEHSQEQYEKAAATVLA